MTTGRVWVRDSRVLWVVAVIALSFLAYAKALTLPFISDDYVQIQLGRDYGPVSGWAALASDALYRCRATSIVLTYWLERAVGVDAFYFSVASLFLHALNALLVLALGIWRPVGWTLSGIAACFFAVSYRHSEAVVWFAALPELLVFLFTLAAFLLWVRYLDSASPMWLWAGSFACYCLALLSKESAVVLPALCMIPVLLHPQRPLRRLWALAPFVLLALAYFAADYVARQTHLHFNDGTFSLHAPFVTTLLRSGGHMFWVWGIFATAILFTRFGTGLRIAALAGVVWLVIALLPYSFLTYMPRVPSRHTYIANVGMSLIIGAGFLAVWRWCRQTERTWIPACLAVVIIAHQCGYLWLVKHHQYADRALPTEKLVRIAGEANNRIEVKCFPYSPIIGELALKIRVAEHNPPTMVFVSETDNDSQAYNFCTERTKPQRHKP